MTAKTPQQKRGLRALGWLAIGGMVLASLAVTSAAYQDKATLNFAKGSIGAAGTFSIQLESGSVGWVEAEDYSHAVVLLASPNNTIRIDTPIKFVANVRVAPDSPKGNILPVFYLASDCTGRCAALYEQLRFDVSYDSTTIATGVTAADFNALASASRTIANVAPGESHKVNISVRLKSDTPAAWDSSESMFGMKFVGVSTP